MDLRQYHTICEILLTKSHIALNEDINKDDTSISNLFKKLLVSANT